MLLRRYKKPATELVTEPVKEEKKEPVKRPAAKKAGVKNEPVRRRKSKTE